jgi:lipid A 3-O-deacylase
MKFNYNVLLFSFLFFSLQNTLLAQVKFENQVQETVPRYVHFDVENDMLIPRDKTDRYFTSGTKLEYSVMQTPYSRRRLQKIFLKLKDAELYIGVLLMANMYTPASLTENPVPGDRPYAGWLCLGTKGISNSYAQATRFTTEYTLGVIGPASLQGAFQKEFHKIIDRPEPKGWKNQIANDLALNLSFVGEKRIFKPSDNVDLVGIMELNIGTVTNYMGFGGMLRAGWFDDYFKNIFQVNGTTPWQVFAFARPMVRIIADNSLLQGGIFNFRASPYKIPKDDLYRFYMETEFGYGITYRKFNFTYSQSVRTAEFKDAKNMLWGKMSFTYSF